MCVHVWTLEFHCGHVENMCVLFLYHSSCVCIRPVCTPCLYPSCAPLSCVGFSVPRSEAGFCAGLFSFPCVFLPGGGKYRVLYAGSVGSVRVSEGDDTGEGVVAPYSLPLQCVWACGLFLLFFIPLIFCFCGVGVFRICVSHRVRAFRMCVSRSGLFPQVLF